MRQAEITRTTTETAITASVALDGSGSHRMATGIGFFDHMLDQLARHSLIDMAVTAKGDLHIDDHHTVEDCGIALGQALAKALGDKRGIRRYGECALPMDDAQVRCALDLSGRPYLVWNVPFPTPKIGNFDTELVREFFQALRHPWRHHAACRSDPRDQQPPHRRGRLQGRRPRPAHGGRGRPAGGRRDPLDEGRAVSLTVLVDYESGNLHSAEKAFQRMAAEGDGGEVLVSARPEDVARADRIVLPGDGAFPACRRALGDLGGLSEALVEAVSERGRPFLGICVGMQMLATRGLEYEPTAGLRTGSAARWCVSTPPTRRSRCRTWVGTTS